MTVNRGDPDIGRIKRRRAPKGMLKINRLTGHQTPEYEGYMPEL
jgi:hypothetical protein